MDRLRDRSTDAEALMVRIAYQLRSPSETTLLPCKRCRRPSPGGYLCANCLCDDLAILIENRGAAGRWLSSIKIALQDEETVLRYARQASSKQQESSD